MADNTRGNVVSDSPQKRPPPVSSASMVRNNTTAAPLLAARSLSALRRDLPHFSGSARPMERTISADIREEREDLKEAAEFTQSVVVDLGLDGVIRHVSPTWGEVIGTPPDSVVGKPIADLLVSDKHVFEKASEAIRKDDSRSQNVRFSLVMGPDSILRKKHRSKDSAVQSPTQEQGDEETILHLEGQGIIVCDRTTGEESHTMWMIKPYVVREVTIDLPDVLVESLGVGAEILARYLTMLAEEGVTDYKNYPRPPPVLCRICERHITCWWFEKHTELCLQEHTAERDIQFSQENLADHRKAIVKVLDALEAHSRQPRSITSDSNNLPFALPEYKGLPIGTTQTPPANLSGRSSPASPPSRSRERPASGFGHHRARSFAVRRPIARIVELVLDLCDTAMEINMPAIKDGPGQADGEIRTQSPGSESRISQVTQWQSPSNSTVEQEQGLSALSQDTSRLAREKVEAVMHYQRVLEYSERIRIEFEILVHECIQAAVEKAAKIAAGELSDSSETGESTEQEQDQDNTDNEERRGSIAGDEPIFPCSLDAPSAMSMALRSMDRQAAGLGIERPPSSAATSTRSSSPRGARTPRSHAGPSAPIPLSKRASMHLESDTGADSDSSLPSTASASMMLGRADSPVSELSLSRVATSRERKRRSLILPSVKTSRQHSPARSMPPPSSPLRMTKNRVPSGAETSQSPITSPVLVSHEFSSPAASHSHLTQFHRRQSSAASSEILKPTSPRLAPVASNPQPRAAPLSIKDFEMIKPISKGAFGSVYLAKKKATGEYFAIKALKKSDMIAKNQVTNVKAERAIMMWQGESDFVAKLYWTFSSKDHLFLVMEYMNGGDCASLLKSLGGLPEDWSKRYLAEVVLGVEHLHSRGIVHRDLKPDNLLIDTRGHLKLTDFGLSRMGIVGRQKRAANSTSEDPPVPDLLKQSSIHRAVSVGSSRSASFDFHATQSPANTPAMTPASGDLGQPSYFSLHREQSRRPSTRSDAADTNALQVALKNFSISDAIPTAVASQSPIDEEQAIAGSAGENSPDPYPVHHTMSPASGSVSTPPGASSGMLMPNLALFDPEDTGRKFVGTPDYLAPETINGVGQDELSDWWSLGCIMFEFLYGYPPFHADTPDEVFQNILARKIDWPPEELDDVSSEAKDLMNRLMSINPTERIGANVDDKFDSGGAEIKSHPWFEDVSWDSLRDDEASFIPMVENPEDTEYFDTRGAVLQSFSADFEEQSSSPAATPGADYPDRPHDALSRVRNQVNSIKRGLIPLHIPPHVRDGRTRRLSEPVPADDFGNFNFKNLPVLEKANKDVIQKLKAEAMQAQSKPMAGMSSPVAAHSPAPSLESSPVPPTTLQRTLSANKNMNRPGSPHLQTQAMASPSRPSQPSSPLLVQFSTGQHHERRKTSSSSSSLSQQTSGAAATSCWSCLSQQTSGSLQPGSFFDAAPRLPVNLKGSNASSPIKLARSPGTAVQSQERGSSSHRPPSANPSKVLSPRARSHTVSSQESEDVIKDLRPQHHKRRSQVFDVSPSSSDNEDTRQKALLRVQRRRQSSRRLSQITLQEGPMFRPLDVLVCEDHPVSRLVMEKLLEKLRCRTVTATNGAEAIRFATSEVKFDIILTEYKLPNFTGSDLARMIRRTKNVNSTTPVVAVTAYLLQLPPSHFFDGLIEKPPTIHKLTEILGRLCQWKPPPPPPGSTLPWPTAALTNPLAAHVKASNEDSPTSFSSGPFANVPSGSYRGSSREDSISSSFFGDLESARSDDHSVTSGAGRQPVGLSADDWADRDLARNFEGLGISSTTTEENTHQLITERIQLPPPAHTATAHTLISPPTDDGIRAFPPVDFLALKKQRSADARIPSGGSAASSAGSASGAARRPQHRVLSSSLSHASAESGDDEDEELGGGRKDRRGSVTSSVAAGSEMAAAASSASQHSSASSSDPSATTQPQSSTGSSSTSSSTGNAATLRPRSPRSSRPRGSSKLGYEMMRTNSRGSVVSADDVGVTPPADAASCGTSASANPPAVESIKEDVPLETFGAGASGSSAVVVDLDDDSLVSPRGTTVLLPPSPIRGGDFSTTQTPQRPVVETGDSSSSVDTSSGSSEQETPRPVVRGDPIEEATPRALRGRGR